MRTGRLWQVVVTAFALASAHCGDSERTMRERRDGLEDQIFTPPTDPWAGLGRGRDLVTLELRDFCIGSTGTLLDYSHSSSHLYLDAAMTKEQIKSTLDLTASVDAAIGKVTGSDEFQFHRSTVENDWSIVLAYGVDYAISGRTMDPNTRKLLVDPAAVPNWFAKCGDHLLFQTDQGGRLFVTARVEFNSVETKKKFQNKLEGKAGGWLTVKSTFEQNREEFIGKAVIRVEAWQWGGNTAAIGELLGAAGTTECGIGDMSKCDAQITKALAYAGSADFVKGMRETPADVRYLWVSWRTVLTTNVPPDRAVPAQIVPARDAIKAKLTDELIVADRLALVQKSIGDATLATTNKFRADLPVLLGRSSTNLTLLQGAVKECFADLDDLTNATELAQCTDTFATLEQRGYQALSLGKVDPSNGTVTGQIDGTVDEGSSTYLTGWACVRGEPSSIEVKLFSGTTQLATARADVASGPEIAQACNSTGSAYRFKIPLDPFLVNWAGAPLTVYGLSPFGDPQAALVNSGSVTMPTGWRYSAEYDSWATGQHVFDRYYYCPAGNTFTTFACVTAEAQSPSPVRYPDLNGDGRADVCTRTARGLQCYLSTGAGWVYSREFDSITMGQNVFAATSDQHGYGAFDGDNVPTIDFPDVNGDGKADACARHDYGVQCWIATENGFTNPAGYDSWRSGQLIFNRYYFAPTGLIGALTKVGVNVAYPDVNGDGKADVCARAYGGLQCYLSTGTGWTYSREYDTVATGTRVFANTSDQHGWGTFDGDNAPTVQFADVNGDGKADACMRHDFGLQCWLSTGAGWNLRPGYDGYYSGQYLFANGWNQDGWGEYDGDNVWTIRFPDVNGDGKADACIRNDSGLECWLSTGSGWTYTVGYDTYMTTQHIFANGWDQRGWGGFDGDNWPYLWYVDLDGDEKQDVCLRNDFGLQCFRSTGDGWQTWYWFDTHFTHQYVFANGSDQHGYGAFDGDNAPLIGFPDVNGDGLADACVRQDYGMQCWLN